MNIKEAKEEIKRTMQAYLCKEESGEYKIPVIRQRPVLLMGPPGIGKTQIMEQIARELKIGLVAYTITHHTRQSAVGLPYIKEEVFGGKRVSVTEYTMSEIIASIYHKIEDTGLREGILFLDEINCVSETLAPTMLQFLQCKRFGNQSIPGGWLIVAAGNPPEYNKSVREFDMVTLDRLRTINVEADFEVWKEYGMAQGIYPAILSYLSIRPDNFYRVEMDVDGLSYVTARGWEDLSCLIKTYEELGFKVETSTIQEYICHEEVAEDAAAYFELYKKYEDDYGIENILNGKMESKAYQRMERAGFDETYSIIMLLSDGILRECKKAVRMAFIQDKWYEFLKEYKKRLEEGENNKGFNEELESVGTGGKDYSGMAGNIYQALLERQKDILKENIKKDFYTAQKRQDIESLISHLTEAVPKNGDSFEEALLPFNMEKEKLFLQEKLAGSCIDNAFTFLSQAAGGQEMTLFVTELTVSQEISAFLSSHPSELYMKYSSQLLMGKEKQKLLKEINGY